MYTDISFSLEIGPLPFSGCDVSITDTDEEIAITANLDGSNVMLTTSSIDPAVVGGCTISGTRK